MALDKHTTHVLDGSLAAFTDRTILWAQTVANAAGGGAGSPVTTAVTVAEGLPANYLVLVTCVQPLTAVNVTGKTQSGFNVVLTPTVAATTLAAGSVDILVLG